MRAHTYTYTHSAMAHLWKSENNSQELFFSFYYVASESQTQVVSLISKCFNTLALLADPLITFICPFSLG